MIHLELHGDVEVIARLDEDMREYLDAVRRAFKVIGFRRESVIKGRKLSGEVLNRRTGRLSASVNTEFKEEGDTFSTRTGIPRDVFYGFMHEYGGTFQVKEHLRTITQAFGRPITPTTVNVRAHTITLPVRSFLRSTLREQRAADLQTLHNEIAKVRK